MVNETIHRKREYTTRSEDVQLQAESRKDGCGECVWEAEWTLAMPTQEARFRFENVVTVTATCVVLHNLCKKYGNHFDLKWEVNTQEQSSSSSPQSCTAGSRSTQAEDIKNAIKNRLSSE